jgi:hypothetical protein
MRLARVEEACDVKQFLAFKQLSLRSLVDTDGKVTRLYQNTGFPTTVLVDRMGQIVGHTIGSMSEQELRALLGNADLPKRNE